tara:strand:- start:57 stop:1259 length:1203 start_codon:yes stop_codon:yes gene_type:complete
MLALMSLMAICALAWMTRPLWRAGIAPAQLRRSANVAAYRQRLGELEADHAAGLVDADNLQSLRQELDQRLLLDSDDAEQKPAAGRNRSVWLVAVLSLLVLALSLFGYVDADTWSLQQKIAQARVAGAQDADPAEIEAMVGGLEERLAQEPDNIEGWVMLGRSHFALQNYEKAANAYKRANELTHASAPSLLVGEAEAIAMSKDQDLRGRPAELFQAALKLDPQNPRALWYAGLAAEQAGTPAQARQYWKTLSEMDVPEALQKILQARLAEPPAGQNPSASEPVDIVLSVDVSIDPALQASLPADATLFVFAKALEGPPMPLAVHRGVVADLPLSIQMDDSMAMVPTAKISQFDAWTLTARISRSGDPQAKSGDLQGSLTVARDELGTSALHLLVDQVVP